MPELSFSEWEAFITQYPETHFLQSPAWGELKRHFGWRVVRIQKGGVGAQILFRTILPGFTMAYIPKGPVGIESPISVLWDELLPEIDQLCKNKHAFLLKIEPDAWKNFHRGDKNAFNRGFPVESWINDWMPPGFITSLHAIQPLRTILVDLGGTEEEILSRMKQKTRYNIRLAQKAGIKVTPSGDLRLFSKMMKETGERDRFGVHSLSYYQGFYNLFHPRNECELFLASFEDEPLAMLMVIRHGKRAWYLYGASRSAHREKMPTYLLQWEAICWAKSHYCVSYDLWGVPDEEEEILEANFLNRSSGLWGVYRFKRGFGGTLLRSAGPWDRIYSPLLFRAYCHWINRFSRRGNQ
jgi:lipid II:glycine glycyltransferase (peptidoglycan interpeptide bridge formation enzyme)